MDQLGRRPVVLIVDDFEDALAMHAIVLSGMGFDVMTAGNRDEAETRFRSTRPDVIVTELMGPHVGAWDVLAYVNPPETDGIPIIILTGYVRSADRERAVRDGYAAYLTKPCPPMELAASLRLAVNGHGA